jgi:hypothetical protein
MHTESGIPGTFFVCKTNAALKCNVPPAARVGGKDEC